MTALAVEGFGLERRLASGKRLSGALAAVTCFA